MSRQTEMRRLKMTVFIPSRRPDSYVCKWTDPVTRKRRQRSLTTLDKREAFIQAYELAKLINAGVSVESISWWAFCQRYLEEHLSGKSPGHRESWQTTTAHIKRYGAPGNLQDITAAWVSSWQAWLRKRGLSVNSVACYSRSLRAALNWARRRDLIPRAPYVEVTVERVPRSSAMSHKDLPRLLEAIPRVRPQDTHLWNRLLRGLSQCNLRIDELRRLSWDPGAPIRIDVSDVYPLIRFLPRAHKSRTERVQVILPAFWSVCSETPLGSRAGYVFPLPNGRGDQLSRKRVIRIISAIGREAGIVTQASKGKCATSHDIGRRAFIGYLDGILTVPETHKAMGHSDFQTTLDYYDTRNALDLAAKLWRNQG